MLLADAAVDAFADQVGVAVVAGVLLEDVDQDLPQFRAVLAGDVQIGCVGNELLREVDLGTPVVPGFLDNGGIGHGAVEVLVRLVVREVDPAQVLAGHHLPKPGPLGLGDVPDQPEQGQVGRRNRSPGQLFRVETGALQLQRESLVFQVPDERVALALESTIGARVLVGVDEHVPPAELPLRNFLGFGHT